MNRWTTRVDPDAPLNALLLRSVAQGLLGGLIFGIIIAVSKDVSHGLTGGVIFAALLAVFALVYNLVLRGRADARSGPR